MLLWSIEFYVALNLIFMDLAASKMLLPFFAPRFRVQL
ncbi:hypothetical protein SIN8267_03273 [Sinobacterium norvegicum]|uniref:Uncharacterized protein n=1 Tax=Sinobacterium norvegicum TaxID=1641715 RepID=A0ABN8EL80_9GAMM|nr:hypothetical protein SIN8267_03273 [Sinobacterium norvegicum]